MDELANDLLRGAKQIAAYMGVSRRQVYHLVETHRMPFFRLGATLCARKSSIIKWIEEQEAGVEEH